MRLIDDSVDLTPYLREPEEGHKVRAASEWAKDVIDVFYRPRTAPKVGLGFQKTWADFEIRPAEVTLWAGINGHGKSQFVGHVTLNQCQQGQRVCVASLEMAPKRSMARMSRQAWGGNEPSMDFIRNFHAWTDGRLWLYDHVGNSNPETMVAIIRYAADKFGIQQFVVDNLTKVVDGEDNYNAQKDFVNRLCTVAHDTGVHIHLVAHVRKSKSEKEQPGKFDVKGAGSITDLVDNVFIVWRNKAKEEAVRTGDMKFDLNEPDTVLQLEKQRNGETEGHYGFWFDPASLQYLEARGDLPQRYKVEQTPAERPRSETVDIEGAF